MPLQNVANIKERYISLCIPLKKCGKKQKIAKKWKISSPAGSRIFQFFLEIFFLFFSHFFKGMNKEKYHYHIARSYWFDFFVKLVLKTLGVTDILYLILTKNRVILKVLLLYHCHLKKLTYAYILLLNILRGKWVSKNIWNFSFQFLTQFQGTVRQKIKEWNYVTKSKSIQFIFNAPNCSIKI